MAPSDEEAKDREAQELRVDAQIVIAWGALSWAYGLWSLGPSMLSTVWESPVTTAVFLVLVASVVGSAAWINIDARSHGRGSRLWGWAAIFTWPIGPVIYLVIRLHGRRSSAA